MSIRKKEQKFLLLRNRTCVIFALYNSNMVFSMLFFFFFLQHGFLGTEWSSSSVSKKMVIFTQVESGLYPEIWKTRSIHLPRHVTGLCLALSVSTV